MPRHLTESTRRSWATFASLLAAQTASGVGGWLTMGVLAALPAIVARWLWLLALAEPLGDEAMATLSANVAAVVTWLGILLGSRRFLRRGHGDGRHQRPARRRVANLFGHRPDI